MKRKIYFEVLTVLILINNGVIYSQKSYSYRDLTLNKITSFNNVINTIEDKRLIITEPGLYTKGEEIKFKNEFNTIATLSFFEDTQKLKSISIKNIKNIEFINIIKDDIIRQLGKPDYGYEIKEFHKVNNNYEKDFESYNIHYEYIIDTYVYRFNILYLYNDINDSSPTYFFMAIVYKKNEYKINWEYYPSTITKYTNDAIVKYTLLNKW